MLSTSRNVALVIAISVSVITTSFLSLIEGVPLSALIVCLILSFASGYILTYFIVEYFIFSQVEVINKRLGELLEDDFSFVADGDDRSRKDPLKKIHADIYSYAVRKTKEIEELKKSEAFRREFVADVSHELKTPIFAAQGYVHTLLDGAIRDKNVRNRFLKKAAKSLDGLDRLVQDLLTISKMETGDIRMDYEYFDIAQVVSEVFDQFEGKAEKRDLKLSFVGDILDRVIVFADRQKIYQVLLNLVSNAIKYKNEGVGLLEVGFTRFGDMVEVMVRDHGMGIPQEHLGRIFERFYRVEKSRSKDKGGTGLGLSIVKHILEAHNTSVEVESTPGKGTTFRFKLKSGDMPREKSTSHPQHG